MIKSFTHKGLETFFHTGSTKGIQVNHAARLARMLERLDAASDVKDMNAPGYGLDQLKGSMVEHWSVKVSGNWRLTFRFEDGHAHVVNYQDYH